MRKYHARFVGGPTEKESTDHLAGGLPNFVINHAQHTTDALLQVKDSLEHVCRRLNGGD